MTLPTSSTSSALSISSDTLLPLETTVIPINRVNVKSQHQIQTIMFGVWELDKIGASSPRLPITVIFKPCTHPDASSDSQSRQKSSPIIEYSVEMVVKHKHKLNLQAEVNSDLNLQLFSEVSGNELNISANPDETRDAALVQAILVNCQVEEIAKERMQLSNSEAIEDNLIQEYDENGCGAASSSDKQSSSGKISLRFRKSFSTEIEGSQSQQSTRVEELEEGQDGFTEKEMRAVTHSTPKKQGVKRKLDF